MYNVAYFDCFSGISGDMIIGALIDAGLNFSDFQKELTKLKPLRYQITQRKLLKNHIAATKFDVVDKGETKYRNVQELNAIVENSDFSDNTKELAKAIFLKIANAEAIIHNKPLEAVHFHEIGAIDTVIDVIGCLVGLNLLGITKVICSRINVGSGFVQCAHGTFPVPAPATAELLKGLPVYSTNVASELVTPTGAAIVSTLADSFGEFPELIIEKIGYGAGTKHLEHPNVLRVFLGQVVSNQGVNNEFISIIVTNIDDMNPQLYEHLIDTLLQNGALDVYLTPILMKKNRPALELTVLLDSVHEDRIIRLIFKETTSIGLRIRQEKRKKLDREFIEKNTKYGKIKFKYSKLEGEIVNMAPEYEDCKRIAKQKNIPLKQVYQEVNKL